MGVMVSRYLDAECSEGALVRFVLESVEMVRVVCAGGGEGVTPWNVIDFAGRARRKQVDRADAEG